MTVTERYINPFTDFGFKRLFGTEPNKDLLINFLNEVIMPKERKISDLAYSSNDHVGRGETDRKVIFDLYCIGANNERFIVEMQKAKQNYFKDRSVFYSSFPIQEQAQRGDWNFKLSEIYTVGVLDFAFSDDIGVNEADKTKKDKDKKKISEKKEPKEVRHEVQLKDQNCKVFYEKMTFIYLEMPHFTKTEAELETNYDKWLFVLKNLPNLKDRPANIQGEVFEHLFESAEIAKFSPMEQKQYEESLKVYRDLKNSLDTAFDEGKIEGRIEGKIEGKIEGRIEGIEEGKMIEKIETIIKALKRGKLRIEEIADDFEVTIDFVVQIKTEYNL